MRKRHGIDYLCNPQSVAVIGASETRGKWGNELFMGIINGGYNGKIYPINPRGAEITGLKAYWNPVDFAGVSDADQRTPHPQRYSWGGTKGY